jgi:hypothetical protein
MQGKYLDIYEQLSVAALTSELHEIMQTVRPGISRNTIRLAFTQGGTTPLRRRIIQEAQKLQERIQTTEAA